MLKYDYQEAILENQLRAITPELMAGSTPSFNHRYIYLLGTFYGFSQEVSTMALAISLVVLFLLLLMEYGKFQAQGLYILVLVPVGTSRPTLGGRMVVVWYTLGTRNPL
jgi:hypothetical protein